MLKIVEIPSVRWSLKNTFALRIGRGSETVADFLENRGVHWLFADDRVADIRLFKGDVGTVTLKVIGEEIGKRTAGIPSLTLIGEPRELAPAAYFFANCSSTLAVAPANNLKRLYFASEWIDPQLDQWSKRSDVVCWIARPTPERLQIARELENNGIPLHIYSRESWHLPQWKGFAADEVETSRRYRYRLVSENSSNYGYHSEKLFNSIRCGCVTFYRGDSRLDLSHASGAFLPFIPDLLRNRNDVGRAILPGIERFLFTDAWEIYSFRRFFERIIDLSQEIVNGSSR